MQEKLFGLNIKVFTVTDGDEIKLGVAVDDVAAVVDQLQDIRVPVMAQALDLLQRHITQLYLASQERAAAAACRRGASRTRTQGNEGRFRPSSN